MSDMIMGLVLLLLAVVASITMSMMILLMWDEHLDNRARNRNKSAREITTESEQS